MTVRYTTSLEGISPSMLHGFFVGWRRPATPGEHLRILRGSSHRVLAVDDDSGRVVGFVNAISDGVWAACVPMLEVLPEHRGRGIGTELMHRLLAKLEGLYMIDLMCDEELLPFYERLGMLRGTGAMIRDFGPEGGEG